MDLSKYKALIFDLFHTLTSVESAHAPGKGTSAILGVPRKAWNDQLLKYSQDRLRGKIQDPYEIIKKMAHAINPNIPKEIIKDATETRMFRFKYALQHIDPSVLDTLAELKDRSKLIGLISNGDVHEISGWVESPLKKYFDSVIFSCNVGFVKPEREIYELSLKELNVTPTECVFIGDGGSNELKGAKEIGMSTVLVTYVIEKIWPEKIDARKKHADFEFSELKKLISII